MEYDFIYNNYSEAASISVIHNGKIALSEMSVLDKGLAHEWINDLSAPEYKDMLHQLIDNSESTFFYSRLNVPEALRGNGLGTLLLEKTIEFCKDNNYFLLNSINNYGDMSNEQLINFYAKNGMLKIHDEGFLVYHKDLPKTPQSRPTI